MGKGVVGTVWAQDAERAGQDYESLIEGVLAADEIANGAPDGSGSSRVADSIYSPTDPRHTFDAGHNNGMFLKGTKDNDSFELKANFRTQFRYVSFSGLDETWTDNAGTVRLIEDRQNLELSRARVIFSGHALTPQCRFFMQMDGNTDSGTAVSLIDAWTAWQFSDSFQIQAGQRKVATGRNWLLGAFDTRLADRAFSNEFFRPSRTTGVWFVGDPTDDTHYELMIGQGARTRPTSNLTLCRNARCQPHMNVYYRRKLFVRFLLQRSFG